jgi:glutamyl-tRNA reductase
LEGKLTSTFDLADRMTPQVSAEASRLRQEPIQNIAKMVATEEEEDIAVAAQADDIAQKLTQYLIEGFKAKTGRDPDRDEIEQLFEELTPERYAIHCVIF